MAVVPGILVVFPPLHILNLCIFCLPFHYKIEIGLQVSKDICSGNCWLLTLLSLLPWMIRKENFLFRSLYLKIRFILKCYSGQVFWSFFFLVPAFSFGTAFILLRNGFFSFTHVTARGFWAAVIPELISLHDSVLAPTASTSARHPGTTEPFSFSGETQQNRAPPTRAADGEIKKKVTLTDKFHKQLVRDIYIQIWNPVPKEVCKHLLP